MGSKFTTRHEVSTIGVTKTLTVTGSAQRVQLVAEPAKGPRMFLIYCTEDVYLRQHGATNVPATSSDFLLKADDYLKITVASELDNYLSILQAGSGGTLRYTECSNNDPGTGTSGAATII